MKEKKRMKLDKKKKFIPIKEPVIYILYIEKEGKEIVYYVGETIKSIRRIYDHSNDPEKEEWVKGGCVYRTLTAPKNARARLFYEAYLVIKLQPIFRTQTGAYLKGYLYKCLKRRAKDDREIIPGYGREPVIPQNVGITVHSIISQKPSPKISQLKSVNPQVYFTQDDRNKERYKRGKFSEIGTTYEDWLVNPDAWGDRNKGCWPMNHEEIRKIHKLVQKRREGFEKDIMRQMKDEIKKVSREQNEADTIKIKSMLTKNTYVVPSTPSVKTQEIILWEKAVNEQKKNSRRGMTYEEALDKQKSEQIYKGLQNTSVAKILRKVERKFF
tara:strand:+ start:626 stop:1606 length:981 start_codon:yes stop_codon:yes gene_type:complete